MAARVLLPDDPSDAVYIVISGVNPEPWEVGEAHPIRRNGKITAGIAPSLKLQSFQNDIKEQLAEHEVPMINGNVRIWFWFWRKLDQWNDQHGRVKTGNYADSTNLQKATEDALQGIVYENDRFNRLVGSEIVDQGTEVTPGIVIAYREWLAPSEHSGPALTLFDRFIKGVKHSYFSNEW